MKKAIICVLVAVVAMTAVFAAETKGTSFFKADIVGWYGGYTFGKEYDNGNRISLSVISNTVVYSTVINIAWAGDPQWSVKTALMPVTPEGFSFNFGKRLNSEARAVELSFVGSLGGLANPNDLGFFLGTGFELSFGINDRASAVYARAGVTLVAFFSRSDYGYYTGPNIYMLPYYVGIGYKYNF